MFPTQMINIISPHPPTSANVSPIFFSHLYRCQSLLFLRNTSPSLQGLCLRVSLHCPSFVTLWSGSSQEGGRGGTELTKTPPHTTQQPPALPKHSPCPQPSGEPECEIFQPVAPQPAHPRGPAARAKMSSRTALLCLVGSELQPIQGESLPIL